MAMTEKDKQHGREPLLELVNVSRLFPAQRTLNTLWKRPMVTAVKDVSLRLYEGETYGLVGESGSGKSTTGRMIVGLSKPSTGEVRYRGTDLYKLSGEQHRSMRRKIQFVFQDPYSSLNPKKRIGDILEEPLIIHRMGSSEERREEVFRMLDAVGLRPEHYFRYPHELSGGQAQRIGIARALILKPDIIVCDEPVSALDVSIQSQILNLFKKLQREMKLTMLFISHDMSVVRYISDRIGVMYLGKIVEEAPTDELFAHAKHPYTQALLSSVPDYTREKRRERIVLRGELPSPLNPPSGCVFHTRCPYAWERCKLEVPRLQTAGTHHLAACHLLDEERGREH
jgi:oligopeptide transport system ATP-binding protein